MRDTIEKVLLGFSVTLSLGLILMFFMLCSYNADKHFKEHSQKEIQRIKFERGDYQW